MKRLTRIWAAILLIFVLIFNSVSCDILSFVDNKNEKQPTEKDESFYIEGPSTYNIEIGDTLELAVVRGENLEGEVVWTSSDTSVATVSEGVINAVGEGMAIIKATVGDLYDRVIIYVTEPEEEYVFGSEYPCISIAEAMLIAEEWVDYASTERYYIVATVLEIVSASNGRMYISDGTSSLYVYKSSCEGESFISAGISEGDVILIHGTLRNYKNTLEIEQGTIIAHYTPGEEEPTKPDQGGNNNGGDNSGGNNESGGSDVTLPGGNDPITSDPYVNVDEDEFYKNYTPAISYNDAYYRTQHNLMSGSIEKQDQKPTIASYQPKVGDKFVRNNEYIFSEDKNTYYVVDGYGEVVMEIYRGGAYVVLEEVAAYVFAFGEPPANHSASKSTKPSSSVWGIYLRVNNTVFSGSTTKYPYEPELPRISGCGGDLTYYEMDIGTTGTDCDPSYDICDYNDGYTITRGAARIVYSAKDRN